MNFPFTIAIGEFSVNAHLLFESLAFFVGFRYYLNLRAKTTDFISDSNRIWIVIGATFGAFLFSRLIGSLENPNDWLTSENPIIYFFKNKTIVGGLLGGLLGVEGIKLILKEKHSSGDLFVFPLILAIIIGRIGCFSSGIYEPTFGIETSSWLGMDLGDGLSRHPVALYEISFLIGLWLLLHYTQTNLKTESGILFKYFLICYLVFRFFMEFIKPSHSILFGLTSIQLTSLVGLAYYANTIIKTIFTPNKLIRNEN